MAKGVTVSDWDQGAGKDYFSTHYSHLLHKHNLGDSPLSWGAFRKINRRNRIEGKQSAWTASCVQISSLFYSCFLNLVLFISIRKRYFKRDLTVERQREGKRWERAVENSHISA